MTTPEPLFRDLTDSAGRFLQYAWESDGRSARGKLAIDDGRLAVPYVVDEDTSEPFPGRCFFLAKADGTGEVYRVECHRGDGPIACSCNGYKSADRAAASAGRRTGRWGRPACKHSICVASLLALGALDVRPEPAAGAAADAEMMAMLDQLASRTGVFA